MIKHPKLFGLPGGQDIAASLGVFVVAVPLSVGIALASGAPAGAGLIAAVVGGLAVGLLSGAPLVVSGPAAGLTALVLDYVHKFGLTGLAIITATAGIIQVACGAARIGPAFNVAPAAMLKGMLAAIGLLIGMAQLHVLMGASMPRDFFAGMAALPDAALAALTTPKAGLIFAIGLGAMAIQILWPKLGPRLRVIPGALPAVALMTIVALPFDLPRVELASLLDGPKAVWSGLSDVSWASQAAALLLAAFGLALVASAETLLTARAVAELAKAKGVDTRTDLNRELMAQGAGNAISGLAGGLPITGVIVRSAANVTFGGRTRWSTILHGAWILLFVVIAPQAIEAIPLTALAAVLVMTGLKLLDPKSLLATYRTSKRDATLWLGTTAAIVATDLLTGLLWGGALAVVLYRRTVFERCRAWIAPRLPWPQREPGLPAESRRQV